MRDTIIRIITESMAVDDRETAGAKALAAKVLALLCWNIPVPVPKGLMNCEPTFSMGSVKNISNSCGMNWRHILDQWAGHNKRLKQWKINFFNGAWGLVPVITKMLKKPCFLIHPLEQEGRYQSCKMYNTVIHKSQSKLQLTNPCEISVPVIFHGLKWLYCKAWGGWSICFQFIPPESMPLSWVLTNPIVSQHHMGQVKELRLSCYLVLLSFDSKTR